MEEPKKQQRQATPKGKKWGEGHAKYMMALGWAEAQKALYADSNIGLAPSVSAEAIKNDLERNRQEAERQAQQQPAKEQEQRKDQGVER